MTTRITAQDIRDEENVSTADNIITANRSVIVSSDYEIGSGFVTEIPSTSTLEIT